MNSKKESINSPIDFNLSKEEISKHNQFNVLKTEMHKIHFIMTRLETFFDENGYIDSHRDVICLKK